MPNKRKKPTAELEPGRTTSRLTISLDPDILEMLERNAVRRGFKHSLSAYIAKLIEEDDEPPMNQGKQLKN